MGYDPRGIAMRKLSIVIALGLFFPACASTGGRQTIASVDDKLALDSVVLYRNGIGYFERHGEVEGDQLHLRVRKDQVNDLLKSLTVVDQDGQAVSVSMPLDPGSWANAALATLAPGQGSLAQVLDSMRGAEIVAVTTRGRRLRGRIAMVEETINEPDPKLGGSARVPAAPALSESVDFKLTLLVGRRMEIVRLSKVRSISLEDGDLAMQLHRGLDASAGEGMFEQVEVVVRLVGARSHRLTVSYVVQAPIWKPTYRVVLPENGEGPALLQGWAVVDNTSGEDWDQVRLALTSGAPIAFRYDLHTPRDVHRADLTERGVRKQARVAVGETSYFDNDADAEDDEEELDDMKLAEAQSSGASPEPPEFRADMKPEAIVDREFLGSVSKRSRANSRPRRKSRVASPRASHGILDQSRADGGDTHGIDVDSLRRSTRASARAQNLAGLTRVNLTNRVTVPDGTSTMVAVLNENVEAEETYLFRPGGAGTGYESNPYHVVRFTNTTDYVLEPGPISIYSGGSFIGEGLSEAVGSHASVTIPFAVEPAVIVTSSQAHEGQEMHIKRIVRGVLEVESFRRITTTWNVRGPKRNRKYRVLIRHPRQGSSYSLQGRPPGTEDLDGAYIIPIDLPVGSRQASLKVVEQTPSSTTLTIWDGRASELLKEMLTLPNLDAATRSRLQPILALRQKIGRTDTLIDGKKKQERELDLRAQQTRKNLEAIKKDGRATNLRARLNRRLEAFTKDGDRLGRKIVELNSDRLEMKIELEDALQDLDLSAPARSQSITRGSEHQ